MALLYWDDEEEEEGFETMGDQFNKDMDALKRACQLTGEDADVEEFSEGELDDDDDDEDGGDDDEDVDDGQYLQSIQQKLMLGSPEVPIPQRSPIAPKPQESDVEEDDADILRAIRNRFTGNASPSYYSPDNENKANYTAEQFEDFSRTAISHKDVLFPEESRSGVLKQSSQEECADLKSIVLYSKHSETLDDKIVETALNSSTDENTAGPKSNNVVGVPFKYSGIPEYARVLIEALKKNRLCQKILRSKLIQIETKLEENKDLRNRAKCLVDFQNNCKRRLTQLLAQDSDPSVKLITRSKSKVSSKKIADNRIAYRFCGPSENPDVAKYRMVQQHFPTVAERNKWSKKEGVDLGNGIKQQVQETLVRQAMELLSSQENLEDASFLDEQISIISQKEITAEEIRAFLPEVDWERLASTYVTGHSGADCEARWLNEEDPLINRGPWTKDEDKKLLMVVQRNGLHNWVHISNLLGTNRTPSQCLSRYQRSLNAHIMRKEWTPDEDEQLRGIVETFGENDWQIIAANMEGRTGAQCLNRWCKSIHPDRKKVGRWEVEEDKRLKLAVMVYGPRTWKKIATFVPGRTEVQCRERWCNVLDPSLKLEAWTEEEDIKLKEAISLYGYCWAKVAIFVPPRTDNQCRRRWKALHPQELAAAQKAGKIRKAALISNFVGRKKERPTIGPGDFLQEQEGGLNSEGMAATVNEDGEKEPCGISKRKRRKGAIDSSGISKQKRTKGDIDSSGISKRKRSKGAIDSSGLPGTKKGCLQHLKDNDIELSVVKRKRTRHTVGQKENLQPSEPHEPITSKRSKNSSSDELPMKASMVLEGHHSEEEDHQGNFQFHSDGIPIDTVEGGKVTSCGTREKRVKGRRSKLAHRKGITNLKMADRETAHFMTLTVPEDESFQLLGTNFSSDKFQSVPDTFGQTEDVSLFASNQGGEAPLGRNTSDDMVKEKQTKSHCKDTSVDQKKDAPEMIQLTTPSFIDHANSDGAFVGSVEGEEPASSHLKSKKRTKVKQTKSVRNPRIINRKKDDDGTTQQVMLSVPEDESPQLATTNVSDYRSETILNTHGQNDNMPSIVNAQCQEIPFDCTKSHKRVNGKQIKSARKATSLNQRKHDKGTMQLMMQTAVKDANLDGMLVPIPEDVPGSCVKSDKHIRMKHGKSIQKAMLVNREKGDQAKMPFVMSPVPRDKYCPTFGSDKFETVHITQDQMNCISSAGNDKGGEVSVGCMKSNKRSKGKDTKAVHKSSTAKSTKDNQGMEQLTMHTATVHENLGGMPVGNAECAVAPSCCVKSDNMAKGSQSKSVPEAISINQKMDDERHVQFLIPAVPERASLPLARKDFNSDMFDTVSDMKGKTNDVSFAFANRVEAIANCCRGDGHIALAPEQDFGSCQVHGCQATIESSIGKERVGFGLPDSSHVPNMEADTGGGDNDTVALAAKTILSWPFYFGLQGILSDKTEDPKFHHNSFEERLEITRQLRVDDQQRNIEKLENGQLSDEKSVLNKDKGSKALVDTESALNENVDEKVEEQSYGIQPRRSRRATRININYKELLKGNFPLDLHKTYKNKGSGNSSAKEAST